MPREIAKSAATYTQRHRQRVKDQCFKGARSSVCYTVPKALARTREHSRSKMTRPGRDFFLCYLWYGAPHTYRPHLLVDEIPVYSASAIFDQVTQFMFQWRQWFTEQCTRDGQRVSQIRFVVLLNCEVLCVMALRWQ